MSAITAGTLGIDGVAAPEQFFVINLCSSTSPMALSHPATPELKRYTFFVSRQRDEGRERFRLHMGYFASQGEAEELLATVRDIYPAAWAGPAPTSGVPRRGKIAPVKLAPQVAQVAAVVPPAPAVAAAAAAAKVEEDTAFVETMSSMRSALAQLSVEEPTLITVEPLSPVEELSLLETPAPKAALPAAPAPASNASPVAAPMQAPKPSSAAMPPAQAARTSPAAAAAQPPRVSPAASAQPAKPQGAAATPAPASRTPEAIATKSAAPAAKSAPAPAAAHDTPPHAATAKPAAAKAPAASVSKARPAGAGDASSPFAGLENEPDVRVVTPEDTQTLRDIRLDAQNNAPPCFAVQLLWSVAPIDMAALPHLAIFDAYKLYNVEGNRQGRKWFGLRLGFFSDPNSATQVANYVRSDYRGVAVVPVAIKERDHASGGASTDRQAAPRLGADTPMKHATDVAAGREKLDGFELLADDKPVPARRDIDAPEQAAARNLPVLNPPAKPAPGKTGKPTGKRVVARPRGNAPLNRAAPGKPNSLESTLEILGASTLSLADEGREILNDSAIREPDKKPSSKFSKLLGRLSGN